MATFPTIDNRLCRLHPLNYICERRVAVNTYPAKVVLYSRAEPSTRLSSLSRSEHGACARVACGQLGRFGDDLLGLNGEGGGTVGMCARHGALVSVPSPCVRASTA